MNTVTITGSKELQAALAALGSELEAVTRDAVNATGLELRSDIVKRYQRGPKSGRIYKRRGVTHQASAPGEAPATDTGRLVASVVFEDDMLNGIPSVSIVSRLAIAAYLEFGTMQIAPRPAWVPAAQAITPKFQKRLEAAIKRATA